MTADIIYGIIIILLAIIGIVGAILPVIPGQVIAYIGLLMAYLCYPGQISTATVIVLLVLMVSITLFDYLAPAWFTKKGGGSRAAIWGSTIGMILGFFLPGMIYVVIGPFVGAFVGELIHQQASHEYQIGKAIEVAAWSFLAFLATTGLKLIIGIVMAIYSVSATITAVANYIFE